MCKGKKKFGGGGVTYCGHMWWLQRRAEVTAHVELFFLFFFSVFSLFTCVAATVVVYSVFFDGGNRASFDASAALLLVVFVVVVFSLRFHGGTRYRQKRAV